MGVKIVTGGTTGAADGTLVSSGNKITFTALSPSYVSAHIRCDDAYWSEDEAFTLPTEIEVSFDAGSTWKGVADNPISLITGAGLSGTLLEDVNYPIRFRQVSVGASTTLLTDGTFTGITALGTVASFTATPSAGQIALSWSALTDRTSYQIDRATDSGFTTGVALDLSPGITGTSYTNTGLADGTTYYFRIKGEGTGKFSDSSSYATANAVCGVVRYREDTFADSDGVAIGSHSPSGGSGTWTTVYNPSGTGPDLRVKSNRVLPTVTESSTSLTVESWLSGSSNADCAAEVDAYVYTLASGASIMIACRSTGASFGVRNQYRVVLADTGTLTLAKMVAGSYTSLGTYAVGTLSTSTTYTLRVEAIGTAIKAYVNGVQRISVTDSDVTAGGGLGLFVSSPTATVYSSAGTGFGADAVRLYNT